MESAEGLGRFGRLLRATKLACDELAPIVRELYKSADKLNELKSDNSAFTIADGLVQEMLTTMLQDTGLDFKAMVGEEDDSTSNLHSRPYTVSGLQIPEQLAEPIERAREALERIARDLGAAGDTLAYQDCTVFVDPIDGTREFVSGLGEQCTILVGFAVDGHPVAGLVYRPVPDPASWALGCKEEGLFEAALDESGSVPTTTTKPNPQGLLTSNGPISPFLERILEDLAGHKGVSADEMRVRAGGVGNKILNLLENKGQLYIQDRGVKRWDTCAPQAVLEARGGLLVKASRLLAAGELESYTYAQSATNLDPNVDFAVKVPGSKANENVSNNGMCESPEAQTKLLKPYANVCGFFALDGKAADPSDLEPLKDMVRSAADKTPPTFS